MSKMALAAAVGGVGAVTALSWLMSTHNTGVAHDVDDYDIIIDIPCSPSKGDWILTVNRDYPQDLSALLVAVMGDYKVGKTFLINKLCRVNLPSSESHRTKGLSFFRSPQHGREKIVFIDTAGSGRPAYELKETFDERQQTDDFLSDLSFSMADARIIVVSNCNRREQRMISDMRQRMAENRRPGDIIIVVHNYYRIEEEETLHDAFYKDIAGQFGIEEVEVSGTDNMTKVWATNQHSVRVFHLYIAKEGSRAGRKVNSSTYSTICQLVANQVLHACTSQKRVNVIADTLERANQGLLKTYFGLSGTVTVDSSTPDNKKKKIVLHEPGLQTQPAAVLPEMQPEYTPNGRISPEQELPALEPIVPPVGSGHPVNLGHSLPQPDPHAGNSWEYGQLWNITPRYSQDTTNT